MPAAQCGGGCCMVLTPCCGVQMADGLEFELPSDVEDDEEIDEDMAFTEEDKIRYAGMFGDDADGGSDGDGGSAHDDDLLASDASEGEDIHPDVRSMLLCCVPNVARCMWTSPQLVPCQLCHHMILSFLSRHTFRHSSQCRTSQMRSSLQETTATTRGGMQRCWRMSGQPPAPAASASAATLWCQRPTPSPSTT